MQAINCQIGQKCTNSETRTDSNSALAVCCLRYYHHHHPKSTTTLGESRRCSRFARPEDLDPSERGRGPVVRCIFRGIERFVEESGR
ncbi:hypothetical protein pipiens_010985 [Culex pipiens pipiens]|uniref:Uncharacterized protein n=1 Tax=Culex pipiens pipiens TaxID=38569 RepID=A0ABD1D810_CULPP